MSLTLAKPLPETLPLQFRQKWNNATYTLMPHLSAVRARRRCSGCRERLGWIAAPKKTVASITPTKYPRILAQELPGTPPPQFGRKKKKTTQNDQLSSTACLRPPRSVLSHFGALPRRLGSTAERKKMPVVLQQLTLEGQQGSCQKRLPRNSVQKKKDHPKETKSLPRRASRLPRQY